MRNVLVVLVPLCIGLTSGFIVPSGTQEKLFNENEKHIFNYKKIKSRAAPAQTDVNSKTDAELNTTKTLIIDKANNDKLNEYLYNDINTKDVKVNERSFIYIKQRSRRPLENHLFLNLVPKERIDISKTNESYLLNRNNVFEEFQRNFLLGRTYIDKKMIENHHCDTKIKKSDNYKKSTNSNSNSQDDSSVSKQKGKNIYSDVKPHSKLYFRNETNKKIAKLTPHLKYSGETFSLKPAIKLYDNVIHPLTKPSLNSGNLYDKTLEKGRKQNTIDQKLKRQNGTQIDRFGFYFCLDCIKKLKKQNFKTPLLIKKNCICYHEEVEKKQYN